MRTQTGFVLLLCLLACGCGGKKKTTQELLGDLKGPKDGDRVGAVRSFQPGKDAAQVVPALIEALKDRDGGVRCSAALKLGSFGDQARDAIPALQAVQKDRDPRVRNAAGKALSRIDPQRFPAASKGEPAQEK